MRPVFRSPARALNGGRIELRHGVPGSPGVTLVTTVTPEPGAVEFLARLEAGAGAAPPAGPPGLNLCWQVRRAPLFASDPGPYPEFAKRCFLFTSKGRTFLHQTVRRPIPSRTPDDPYNRPPWVQEYVRAGHDLPDAEALAKSWAGYSPDRFTLPVIGVVSRDGKYLAALANDSASGMCQAWHDCLHNNPEWRLQGGPGHLSVWRLKVYAMANDPDKLLARVAKDFPDLQRPRSAAGGAQISFHVENDLELPHPEVAVKGGVPLPKGEARPGDRFVVTDTAGKEVPAQVNVTGFWPDGSVKWLLVILSTSLEPRGRREFHLEVRPTGRPAPEVHAIAQQDDDTIHVNTGTMEFSVSKRRPGLFQRLALMADGKSETVIDGDHTAGLFVEVARGDPETGARTRFEANAEPQDFTATLEEAGPRRAVICLRGIHVSSSGERFGNYTLRIYAHAGSSQIRLVHSFIYTGDPRNDFVRSIGLRIKPALGALQSYTLGGERGPGITTAHNEDPDYPIWQKAVLSQESALHYSVRKWVDPGRNRAVTLSQGRRSQGWGDISGERATVMVGIRNFWQEYPKAIEVDAQQRELEWASLLKLPDAEFRKIQPNTEEGDTRDLETMRTIAYTYRETGDPSYRSMIEKGLNVRVGRFEKLGGSSPLQAEEHLAYRWGSAPNELENAHTYYLSQSLLPLPYGLAVLAHQGSARR